MYHASSVLKVYALRGQFFVQPCESLSTGINIISDLVLSSPGHHPATSMERHLLTTGPHRQGVLEFTQDIPRGRQLFH